MNCRFRLLSQSSKQLWGTCEPDSGRSSKRSLLPVARSASSSEYRTRLIADVVTGKLDVREAAASLLEEADERDPPDEVVLLADDVVDNLYHRVGRGAGNGK